MSRFDEIAHFLTNPEKTHLAMARKLIASSYKKDLNEIIAALLADSDELRAAVEKHVAANRWHPIPLMMLAICMTVVFMTAYLLIDKKLTGAAGLATFVMALISLIPVWRTNLERWHAGKNWLMLLPGLACPAEVRNTVELQKLVNKYSDELTHLKINKDVKAWTMKEYLVVWMTLDPYLEAKTAIS